MSKRSNIKTISLIAFILFAVHVFGQNSIEDYQIYSTVLHTVKENNVVISNMTVKSDNLTNFISNIDIYKKEDPKFKEAIEKDLNWLLMVKRLQLADTIHKIKNKFDSNLEARIMSQKRLDRILGVNLLEGTNTLRKESKDFSGVLEFSNVIFNKDCSNAVVYSSFTRGTTGGNGLIYFLVKGENGWTILYKRILWFA